MGNIFNARGTEGLDPRGDLRAVRHSREQDMSQF
jgi:hypothetical protein